MKIIIKKAICWYRSCRYIQEKIYFVSRKRLRCVFASCLVCVCANCYKGTMWTRDHI